MPDPSANEAPAEQSPLSTRIGVTTGTSLIVANMIGVGGFTTTGFMLGEIKSPLAVLTSWLLGGVAGVWGGGSDPALGPALAENGRAHACASRVSRPPARLRTG